MNTTSIPGRVRTRLAPHVAALLVLLAASAAPGFDRRPDIVIADFEADTYGEWVVTGTAFGSGPARGTLKDQMQVTGYLGRGLVNSYLGGDGSTGTLTSPDFVIERRWLNFLIGGGMHPGRACLNLVVDGKVARTATGPNDRPGGTERLDWAAWDVGDLQGRTAHIEIIDTATEGWGHINVDQITLSDEKIVEDISADKLYNETYRPQFHFTPAHGWTNDPNGLVYYRGEYHLFFQHNPFGTEWGNMTWGHAVSRDLVHWEQLANAIEPDKLGTIFSGSAVVDVDDTAGFARGSEKAIVAIYTAAGGTSPASQGQRFTQCIAYSTDRGRTWTKWQGNPVLAHVEAENRDPKVVWHAPTKRWIMALYLNRNDFALYRSADLKSWEHLQTLAVPDCAECPDFFEMPVAGKPGIRKWVLTAANGRYLVGDFDGGKFAPDGAPMQVDYGANYYAVQTYSDVPRSDGRRIQIAWMNGGQYPKMPFNQQMSFPAVLSLRQTDEGLRIYRWPVAEISKLAVARSRVANRAVTESEPVWLARDGDLWDVEVELDPGSAHRVSLDVRGEPIAWDRAASTISCLGRTAPVRLVQGRLRLRVLVDRTSIEVFANGGATSMTSCFLPRQKQQGICVRAEGGEARIVSGRVTRLRSAWPHASANAKP